MVKATIVKADIKNIKKSRIVKTGERFLNVEIEVIDGTIKETRFLGYPIDTPEKEIRADLKKLIATFKSDKAQAKVQAETDAEDQVADETIEKLEGVTIE